MNSLDELLERLNQRWERMEGAAARKIDCILKDRREAAAALEVAAPFFRLADEIVNAKPGSDSYCQWLADSRDHTVIFSFAGQNISLGELRKAAAVVSNRKDGSSPKPQDLSARDQ